MNLTADVRITISDLWTDETYGLKVYEISGFTSPDNKTLGDLEWKSLVLQHNRTEILHYYYYKWSNETTTIEFSFNIGHELDTRSLEE